MGAVLHTPLLLLLLLGAAVHPAVAQRLEECTDLALADCGTRTHCVLDEACTPSCRWLVCEEIAAADCTVLLTEYCQWDTETGRCCRTGDIGCHDPGYDACEQDMYSFFGTQPCSVHKWLSACANDFNCKWQPALCDEPVCVPKPCEEHLAENGCEADPMCVWTGNARCVQAVDRPPMCAKYLGSTQCTSDPGCTWDDHYCVDTPDSAAADPECGAIETLSGCDTAPACSWSNMKCWLHCAGLDATDCARHISRCHVEHSRADGMYGLEPDAEKTCRPIRSPHCPSLEHHVCERHDKCRLDGTACVDVRLCHSDKPWSEDAIGDWLAGPDFLDDCRAADDASQCHPSRGCSDQSAMCGRCTALPCEAYARQHNCEARADLCEWTAEGVCRRKDGDRSVVCTLVPTQDACDNEFSDRCHWNLNRCAFGAMGCLGHTSDADCPTDSCYWTGAACVARHACEGLPNEGACVATFGCMWMGQACRLAFHSTPTRQRDVFDPEE